MNISDLVPSNDWGKDKKLKEITNLPDAVFLSSSQKVHEALDLMLRYNFDQFPLKDTSGKVIGVITSAGL